MPQDVYEEFLASGKDLVQKVRELLDEGNVRQILLCNSRGEILFEVSLPLGIIGMGGAFALAPILSSIAAFAFFAKDARILVTRLPENKTARERSGHAKKQNMENDLRNRPGQSASNDPFEVGADFEVLD